jgi:hypothetical protein
MIRIEVHFSGTEFEVAVVNTKQSYRRVFGSFEPKQGPFGLPPGAFDEAKRAAFADASDWVAKFTQAGIKPELVEVV